MASCLDVGIAHVYVQDPNQEISVFEIPEANYAATFFSPFLKMNSKPDLEIRT